MNALEKVVRPIVEGQVRGFLKEHPSVVEAVDWFKPGRAGIVHDKAKIFVGSLAKRIVRDLTCGTSTARLAAALLEGSTEAPREPEAGTDSGPGAPGLALKPEPGAVIAALRENGWRVAAHNDYRIDGKDMTFWLLTHPCGTWIKGEGRTDAEALAQCEAVARKMFRPSP